MNEDFKAYNYPANGVTHVVTDANLNERAIAWFMSQDAAMRYADILRQYGHKC